MLAVISTLSLGWAPPADPCAAHSFSYTCKTAPINKRVDDLLSKLSTQELIQQTWSPNSAPTAAVGKVGQYGVGQLSYGTSVLSHGIDGWSHCEPKTHHGQNARHSKRELWGASLCRV